MGSVVSIDIESYSEVDLSQVGLWAYASHKSTRIELVSFAVDNGPVVTIDYTIEHDTEPMTATWLANHTKLWELLRDRDNTYQAFNAQFERVMFDKIWDVQTDLEQWHCTMIHAWSLGFSGGLGSVGKQIGLNPDKQKLAEGQKLVLKFCKPAPRNHLVDRYDRHTSPELWARYIDYNRQDVTSEREIKALLLPYPISPAERGYYLLDQRINDRGMPIDIDLVNGAVKINREEKRRLRQEINALTGLENGTAPGQLKPWLEDRGLAMPDLQKKTVDAVLKLQLTPEVRQALEIRRQISQTTTTKYEVVQRCTVNHRLHGVFQFAGAQRTQRWAGRMFQPHNLKQGYRDADQKADILKLGIRHAVDMLYGDVVPFLGNVVRTVVTAPEGRRLAVSDYSSIESRVLGYVSNCSRINALFASGMDSYKDFATEVYRVPYDQVTDAQRKFCKPPVLGCGYQLGDKGLVKYADGMGVELHLTEASRLVHLWRRLYPEVVDMWEWLTNAAKHVITTGQPVTGYCVTIRRDNNFMFIDLPSGRSIAYFHPLVEPRTPPWGGRKLPTVTYMGMNQYNHQWERITTHGGKLTENIVQAIARDILCDGMTKVDDAGMPIILHVHDEVGVESDDADRDLAIMNQLMSQSPGWMPGILLEAEGFTTYRYRKN